MTLACIFLGHSEAREAFGDLTIDRVVAHAEFGYCTRCGMVLIRRIPPRPVRIYAKKPALKIWPLLLRVAPKGKFSDLAAACYEQGFVVDMQPIPRDDESSSEEIPQPAIDVTRVEQPNVPDAGEQAGAST